MAVDAITATVLPAPYEIVLKHPRRRLLRPRPLNQVGRACTLAIKLESFAYIAGRRRRLPRLRSTSGLLVTSVGTVVSSSSKTPSPPVDFVAVDAVPEFVRTPRVRVRVHACWSRHCYGLLTAAPWPRPGPCPAPVCACGRRAPAVCARRPLFPRLSLLLSAPCCRCSMLLLLPAPVRR